MARLVRHEADGPIRVDPTDKPIFICACGLTSTPPMCDGSHKACKGERPGRVYVYDPTTKAVIEERADDASGDSAGG